MVRRKFFEVALGAFAAGAMAEYASAAASTDGAAFKAARRFAQTSFGKVAYTDKGAGDAALFLHGFPLNSFQWRGAIARLSAHRRCIAPDFLGLGFTQVRKGQSCAPDAQVSMVAALLDQLKISSVDLVASDSGGAIAQLFVTRYPKRVRTMLLTNCDVEPDSPPPALQPVLRMAREGKFADKWIGAWYADKALARSPKGIGGMTYSNPMHPTDEAIDYYFGPLVSTPEKKALLHAYTLGLDPNPLAGIEAKLKECAVPTRILWGTADDIFSRESPGYLDRTLPNSRGVRHIEGAKLFWPEEYPEIIAEEAKRLWVV